MAGIKGMKHYPESFKLQIKQEHDAGASMKRKWIKKIRTHSFLQLRTYSAKNKTDTVRKTVSVSRKHELLRANRSYSTKCLFYFVSIALDSLQHSSC